MSREYKTFASREYEIVTLVTWIYCSSRANTTLWLRCTLCSDENKNSIYKKTSSWNQNIFVSSKHVVSFVLSPLSHLAQLPSCFFSMLFNPQYITIYIKVNRIKSKFSFFIVFNCFLFCQQKNKTRVDFKEIEAQKPLLEIKH